MNLKFDWTTERGFYKDCWIDASYYLKPRNKSITIRNASCFGSDYICRASINIDEKLPDNQIAIKDYSENEGTIDNLKRIGILGERVKVIQSGWVQIPVFELTDIAMKLWE